MKLKISITCTNYVLNDVYIYIQASTGRICGSPEGKIQDIKPQNRELRPNGRVQS